ncbi:MAG: hypothetical protein K2O12_06400, partial [Muribaculaceae bacterium]|nr:hypothetical protein [Muribaculaceae bacterium]
MNTLIRHIEYLVTKHDCVIVPGLGAFIAQYQSAVISEDGLSVVPPSRMLVFNGALMHNDGLLAASVARKERVHYDEALSLVKQGVTGIKRQLELDEEVSLGSLGRLIKAENGQTIIFEPSATASYCPEFTLLKTLDLVPLHRRSNIEDDDAVAKNRNVMPAVYNPLRNVLRIAASFAVIIALTLCLTTPISVNEVSLASMGVANTPITTTENVAGASRSAISLTRLDAGRGIGVVDTASHNAYVRQMQTGLSTDKYFLIVASLPTEANAREYMSYSSDARLRILKSDSRCRIYVASAATQAEALNMASKPEIRSEYPDVWVY